MSEMNIDSLKIEIASNSEKAEKSIENLATSLGKLKSSLNGMGVGAANARSTVSALMPLKGLRATNIDKVVSHLERLSKVDLSNLNGMKSLLSLSNLNTKDTGLNNFVNALARLSKESGNFKPDILDALTNSLSKLGNVSASAESLSKFVSSMATFIRYTNNMKATANAFPALADSLNKFFDAMSKTNISDNTVRMAEALATLSKNGKKVSSAMKEMDKSEQDAGKTTANLKDWLNYILDTLRKFSGTALSGLKNVVTHLMNMGKAKNNVSGLAVNLKTLLTTLVGFRGITGVFNWAKDLVSSGAELTEINHIVESVFGEDMVGYVQDWADTALESFGIASTAAKKYAGTMSAMFQASNVGMKDSNKMATDLVSLAGDLSAFYNIDTETAYNKLKSGMAGMVRPLRRQNCAYVQKCA